jgi:putative toxin-antitoxin system antitoxin component (TIGR02293 family)
MEGDDHKLLECICLIRMEYMMTTAEDKLNPKHSEAELALMEVTEAAEKVLGSRLAAEQWLTRPAIALDRERPIDLLTSTTGIQAVKDLLTRMEHGVYS